MRSLRRQADSSSTSRHSAWRWPKPTEIANPWFLQLALEIGGGPQFLEHARDLISPNRTAILCSSQLVMSVSLQEHAPEVDLVCP